MKRNNWLLILYSIKMLLLFFVFLVLYNLFLCDDIGQLKNIFFKSNLFVNIFGSVVAGILLTTILFLVNEYFYSVDINGEWEVVEYFDSTNTPYKGYQVFYIFHLLQQGNIVSGYGEKISQIESETVTTVFETDKRVRLELTGYITKGYILKRTTVNLISYQEGRRRDSTDAITLNFGNSNLTLIGNFSSTAGSTRGRIHLKKSF